jgi:hypothetical protein
VVQEVLPHQVGRHQAHAVAVHQLQEIPPRLIDEGNAGQVYRECPVRMARLGSAPAVFSLRDPYPGEPAFELQAALASGVV